MTESYTCLLIYYLKKPHPELPRALFLGLDVLGFFLSFFMQYFKSLFSPIKSKALKVTKMNERGSGHLFSISILCFLIRFLSNRVQWRGYDVQRLRCLSGTLKTFSARVWGSLKVWCMWSALAQPGVWGPGAGLRDPDGFLKLSIFSFCEVLPCPLCSQASEQLAFNYMISVISSALQVKNRRLSK